MRQHEDLEVLMNFKKLVLVLSALILAGCAEMNARAAEIDLTGASPVATDLPARTPTPTVGYQSTAMAAQMTADASMRLQVEATSAQADRNQVNIMLTARADEWAATAAFTSVPLTATAFSINATTTKEAGALEIMRVTSTAAVPTQIVAIADAKAQAETARLRYVGQGVALLTMSWMMFALGLFTFVNVSATKKSLTKPTQIEVSKVSEVADVSTTQAMRLASGTVITIRKEDGGVVEGWRYVVPCDQEMLTEFAEGVLSGEKTLAFGEWEGEQTLWTRKSYMQMRNFLLQNRFAFSAGAGSIVLNENGKQFLVGWLDARALPQRFEFDHEDEEIEIINPHTHEVMAMSGGVGKELLTANN